MVSGFFFFSPAHGMESVRVGFIADGDTIRLEDNRWVRLLGIDAPERFTGREGSCAGAMSREKLSELLGRNFVFLEKTGKDRFGRILGKLYLENGLSVNDEMIRQGMAWVLPDGKPDTRMKEQIKLQREAMEKGAGIWARLPENSPLVLGNRNSYRFHEIHCKQAKKISYKNQIHFNSYREAFLEGYAPARECIKDPVCPFGF